VFDFLRRGSDGSFERAQQSAVNMDEGRILIKSAPQPVTPEEAQALAQYIQTDQFLSGLPASRLGLKTVSLSDMTDIHIEPESVGYVGVIPEETRYAEQYRTYCERAVQYLRGRSEFSGLEIPEVDWLQQTTERPRSGKIAGYVAHGIVVYQIYSANIRFTTGKTAEFEQPRPNFIRGSLGYNPQNMFEVGRGRVDAADYSQTKIVVSTSLFASGVLMSPYSELLSAVFDRPTRDYFNQKLARNGPPRTEAEVDELSRENALLMESITESVAAYLTMELLGTSELAPAREYVSVEDIRRHVASMPDVDGIPSYALVPKALAYLERHGLRATVELYKRDPSAYLEAVRAFEP
jgi:hypothetical protein